MNQAVGSRDGFVRVQPSDHVKADLDILEVEQGGCTLVFLLTGLTGKGWAVTAR